MEICADCGAPLTDDEKHYLNGRCGKCETDWSDRIDRWRKGAIDGELDKRFWQEPQRVH